MGFLSSIFGQSSKKIPHGALPWVDELKGMDEISMIEFATQQLKSDLKNNLFENGLYLEAFISIDAKIHTIVEKLTDQYINIEHLSFELEERISNAAFIYHRQIFLIYITLIDHLAPFQPSSLPLMLSRAIYSATQMIKWRYYNFQSAPANVWIQISRIYLIGEKYALVEANVQPYSDKPVTTLSSLYIQVFMLGNLESLSLKHQQVDLVSKVLEKWTPKILVQKEFDAATQLFYVDTASDMPARRIRNVSAAPNCRYWRFDSVNTEIALCLSLIEFNNTPKQHLMSGLISSKYALETFKTLRSEWSVHEYKRQRRRVERTKIVKAASATYGFDDTCFHIKQYESIQIHRGDKKYNGEKTFEERLASHHVTKDYSETNITYVDLGADLCNIVDESIQGLGLHISKPIQELSLGMLMSITTQDKKADSKVGVIRCIKPIIGNELHLGIEVLSKASFCVEATNMSRITTKPTNSSSANMNDFANTVTLTRKDFADTVSFYKSATNFTCIFLPKEFSVVKVDTLIIPRLHYSKNDAYKVNLSGSKVILRFSKMLESHEDWLRVSYTIVAEKKIEG